MAAQNNNPQQQQPARPAPKQLNAAPFVFDGIAPSPARAWFPSKPTDKNREQITIAVGSVTARIAGSSVTFPMDVNIVFADKTSSPDVTLRQPWNGRPGGFGGTPLFTSDDDKAAKIFHEAMETITDDFLQAYEKLPAESRLDFASLTYDSAALLVKAKTGSVRRSLARPAATTKAA